MIFYLCQHRTLSYTFLDPFLKNIFDIFRKSDSLPGLDTGGSLHSCPPSCTCSCSEDNISRIEVGGDAGDNKADKKGGVPRGILAGKNQNGGNGTLKRGESKKIKVEYLGSIPVESKATDLSSLQVKINLDIRDLKF